MVAPPPRSRARRAASSAAAAATERAEAKVTEMLACVRPSGLKLTPQRIAIVRELAADETHPTAQELFERLRPSLPTMSFATVYNTLDALASAGLCAALSLAPGPARFDPNMRPHHHAVCDRCGRVRDVAREAEPEGEGASAPLSAEVDPGFAVRAVELIYRGICTVCAKGSGGPPARA